MSRWHTVPLLAGLAVAAASAGCGGHRAGLMDLSVRIPAATPPPSASWPPYPRFPERSCWARRLGGRPLRAAPSLPAPVHATAVTPQGIVHRVLAGLGDRRYVLRVELGPPPRITLEHLRGYYAGRRPPKDALWAYVAAPVATRQLPDDASPAASGAQMVADWETHLVVGALRDDFCAAGGRPLVGWTIGRGGNAVSDATQAFEQRFPNPPPAVFRRRVELVGRRYGFTVDELRLLHPRQLAPLLVVHTKRERRAFVADVPKIMRLLDPMSTRAGGATAITFEGFYFAAADDDGPFVRVEDVYRGEVEGGQWSWSPCVYPYAHSQPLGARPC
jgi:hypothetical protein